MRLFAYIVTLSAALAAASAYALDNPAFEGTYTSVAASRTTITGVVAPGWTDNSSWAEVTLRYAKQTTGTRKPGSACQQITLSNIKGNGEWQFLQEFQGKAGYRYQPGLWLKGTKGARVWLGLRQSQAPYKTYQDVPADMTGAWQYVSVPAHITTSEPLTFMLHGVMKGIFCVDDASLKSTLAPVTPKLLEKPSLLAFGMHIENYLDSKGPNNLNMEGAFLPVNSSSATVSGRIARHWFDNSDWADVTVSYVANTSAPHAGKASQRMTVGRVNSGYAQAAQLLYLRNGQTYSAGIWLRGTKGMKLGFALRKWTEPYTDYAARDLTATGAWQFVSISGQVTNVGVSAMMVRAYSPGTVDFDDASLRVPAGATPKLDLPWPSTKIGTWRLWDQDGTTWADLEPEKGKWDFSKLDAALKDAEANKAQIVLTLGQSPPWASARISDTSYNGAGAPAEPRDMKDWTNYLRKVATRYKGRIFYYEIWNEPNDATFYSGSVTKLAEMTKLARSTLKQVDSRNQIVSASPYNVGYLQEYLKQVRDHVDIVGYHIYNDPPEDDARILADLRSVMSATGTSKKPLWITEGGTGSQSTPASVQARLAARKYLVNYTYGASRFYWYNWGTGHSLGLPMTEADGIRRSPAGTAVAVLQNWLIGATIEKSGVTSRKTWYLRLRTKAGKPAYIIWNPGGSKEWTRPTGFIAKSVLDLAGKSKTAPAIIQATPEPIMVVGQ
jgi:hypothetical protein